MSNRTKLRKNVTRRQVRPVVAAGPFGYFFGYPKKIQAGCVQLVNARALLFSSGNLHPCVSLFGGGIDAVRLARVGPSSRFASSECAEITMYGNVLLLTASAVAQKAWEELPVRADDDPALVLD